MVRAGRTALAAGALAAIACAAGRVERRGGTDVPAVSAAVAADTTAVAAAIDRLFRARADLAQFERFLVVRPGDEYFPSDEQLQHYMDQPALQAYVATPATTRTLDRYVYDFSPADDGDAYWSSEYYVGDAPAPFRCNFLVHLAAGPQTTVSIFEIAPRVWVGRRFAFEAHGPGMYLDVRPVAPTTSDRRALLELIRHAVLASGPPAGVIGNVQGGAG